MKILSVKNKYFYFENVFFGEENSTSKPKNVQSAAQNIQNVGQSIKKTPIKETPKGEQINGTSQNEPDKEVQKTPKNIAEAGAALAIMGGAALICAQGIAHKPKEVAEIVGGEKFRKILTSLSPENYVSSAKNFKANFHIHSIFSDGKLDPSEILEQALQLSKKLSKDEKFYFALTDHDSIEGVKIIAKEMNKNPEKYSRLAFVPGVEMSAKYTNPSVVKVPIAFDFLIYGFDVDNSEIAQAVEKNRDGILKNTQKLFEELNKENPNLGLSVEKMRKEASDSHLRYIGSNGYLKALRKYVGEVARNANVPENKLHLAESAKKFFGHEKYCFNDIPDMESAVRLAKSANAVSVLAHPGKFNFGDTVLVNGAEDTAASIFTDFKRAGGEGSEYYYQAYKNGNVGWWQRIKNVLDASKLDFLRSGGYDTHNMDISA